MTESGNVYQFDESFWNHKNHNRDVVIQLSKDRRFYILNALEDAWRMVDPSPADAKNIIGTIAGLLMASANKNIEMFLTEIEIQEQMIDLDKEFIKFLGDNNE